MSFSIEYYLTPLALAIWVLQNGRVGFNGEILLYTSLKNFEDINRLKRMLVYLYGFNCYIFKDSVYGIQLDSNSLEAFLYVIIPQFSSMRMQNIKKVQLLNNLLNHRVCNSNTSKSILPEKPTGKLFNFKGKCSFNHSLPKFYSTSALNNVSSNTLNPYFVTGFCDGESTFYLGISKSSARKTGWMIIPSFSIEVYDKDKKLIEAVKYLFSVGNIRVRGRDNQLIYSVSSIEDLKNIIIPHFEKFPLLTQKWSDFELFKSAIDIIHNKDHLTEEGLHKIISIKASMNKGLSESLCSEFSVKPFPRPTNMLPDVLDFYWLAGFVEAEGCFYAEINKSTSTKLGKTAGVGFKIGLHLRDNPVLLKLHQQLGCGAVREDLKYNSSTFLVKKLGDICSTIIPIFEKYPLLGVKNLNYLDFCKIVTLMKNKEHLTKKGLIEIEKIKQVMNKQRE